MILRALIASLLIHLLLFLGARGEYLSFMREIPVAGLPLNGVLVRSANTQARDQVLPTARARPESRKTPGVTKRSLPQLASREAAEFRVPVFPQNVSSTVLAADTAMTNTPGSATAPPEVSAKVDSQPDSYRIDGLRQYRLALAREARRYKRYPAVARERGWEGLVTVLVSVPLVGAVPVVSVDKSSGYELLDNQALEMMKLAARDAPLPEALRGGVFSLSLPVRYSLDDN